MAKKKTAKKSSIKKKIPKVKNKPRKDVRKKFRPLMKKRKPEHGIASRASMISKASKPVIKPAEKKISVPVSRHPQFHPHHEIQKIKPREIFRPKQKQKIPITPMRPVIPIETNVNKKVGSHFVSSGIPGFDILAGSGFEKNSINLIVGGSGAGKSIFALQFLLEGLKKGERVLYVTFEEQKDDFYDNIKHLGWDLEKAEQTGRFIFLEYSPEKVKMMLDEGGGAVETTVFKNKISRMVVDSLTSFALLFDDERSRRQAVLGFFDIIRKWNCTTLLTVQQDPTNTTDRGMTSFEFEADSITLLYYSNIKNQRRRFIEILKMRGRRHSKEMHVFKIDKGVAVGPSVSLK